MTYIYRTQGTKGILYLFIYFVFYISFREHLYLVQKAYCYYFSRELGLNDALSGLEVTQVKVKVSHDGPRHPMYIPGMCLHNPCQSLQ